MTNVVGTQTLLDAALQHGIEKFVHVSTDEVYGSIAEGSWDEDAAARAQLAVLRLEGLQRPARPRLPPHPRPAGLDHAVLEQLRALPVPREGHPAVRHQPDRRRRGPAVRRGRERPRLAARRRPLPRHRPRAARRPPRRGLQHRRRHRAHQQGAHRPAARGDRHRLGPRRRNVADRLGHDLRYSVDITKISSELGYAAAGPLRRRAWPTPSSGTAATVPGGSRSRSGLACCEGLQRCSGSTSPSR